MPTDRGVSASGIAKHIGDIKDFLGCHGYCRDNHRKLICGHRPGLLLCTSAPVHRASNIARVVFWMPWGGINGHPALAMAKGAEDDTPGVGTRARLSDGPAVFFRVLEGFTNVSMWMVRHGRLYSARCWCLWYSHYTMRTSSSV